MTYLFLFILIVAVVILTSAITSQITIIKHLKNSKEEPPKEKDEADFWKPEGWKPKEKRWKYDL